MTTVAVVAHAGKSLGGGLPELRRRLAAEGVDDPQWYEVDKSRKAPRAVRKALGRGADLVLVWGGDGMVQRAVDTLAGTGTALGILPAGTANLFATNLGIPRRLDDALEVALHGRRRLLDVGVVDGERFAVMAGAGFDALMIAGADGKLKDRAGRLAYVWSATRAARSPAPGSGSALTAGSGLRVGRAACCWGRSGRSPAGWWPFPRPARTTDCWRSGSSPPTAGRSGPGCWARWRWGGPTARP